MNNKDSRQIKPTWNNPKPIKSYQQIVRESNEKETKEKSKKTKM